MEVTSVSEILPRDVPRLPWVLNPPMKQNAPWASIFLLDPPYQFDDLLTWYWACFLDQRRDAQ